MINRKLALVTALLLLVAAAIVVGASQPSSQRVPPGAIVVSPNASAHDLPARQPVPAAPELPKASAAVMFSDGFSGEGLASWQSLDSAAGNWSANNGRLEQAGDLTGEMTDEPAVLLAKGVSFADGTIDAYIYPTSGTPVGVVFRGSDAGYYRVSLYGRTPNDKPKAHLERVTSRGVEQIASAPFSVWPGYTHGQWHRVTVSVTGSQVTVSVGGAQIIQAMVSNTSAGWAGLWAYANMGAQFDNVRIQQSAGQ